MLLFTEAATHGAFPWHGAATSRRTVFYRYCPPNFAYGRGYADTFAELSREVSEREAVVLQPPFVNRLNRLYLEDDGSVGVTKRSEEKLAYDKSVFECEYF